METTDWDSYGTGRYEKCANCMAHCGYEATAATATLSNPLQAMRVALRGPRTEGPMAPEISLEGQRPAQYVFSQQVQQTAVRNPHRRGAGESREEARRKTRFRDQHRQQRTTKRRYIPYATAALLAFLRLR